MENEELVLNLWSDIDRQNWGNLASYFVENAVINWHNTNESFSVADFVTANSEYPGDWLITVEKLLTAGDVVISVVRVRLKDAALSFHTTSFFKFNAGRVELIDEYWSEDGAPPGWRIDRGIGRPIS